MKRIISYVFLLFCTVFYVHAQDEYKSLKYMESVAEDYFLYEEFRNALPLYIKLIQANDTIAEYHYRLGVCYLHTAYFEKALPYLENAKELGYFTKDKPKVFRNAYNHEYESIDLNFNLGRAYHVNYQFDTAIAYYERELNSINTSYRNRKKHISEIQILKKLISEAKSGIQLTKDTANVIIENLGDDINSEYEEIVPLISADESVLLFTSRRPSTTGGHKDEDGLYMEDIYISHKENGKWGRPKNIGTNINTDEHDACIGLSVNGEELYVYRNNKYKTGDIYVSHLKGAVWSEPKKMPKGINTKNLENSASVSADGKRLFFTSDRKGGFGGEDVYVVEKLPNGEWGEPINLGEEINTPYDDDAPYIHPDGKTLYFSSRGHNTMGGYDIFQSKYKNGKWSKAINLGHPINTPRHDIFFVWSADGKRAYFATHREDSYGEEDLYVLTIKERKKVAKIDTTLIAEVEIEEIVEEEKVFEAPQVSLIVLKGIITTDKIQQKIKEQMLTNSVVSKENIITDSTLLDSNLVNVDVIDTTGVEAQITIVDNETAELIGIYHSNSVTGKYTIVLPPGKNYGISVEAKNCLPYSENINLPDIGKYYEDERNVILEALIEGSLTTLKNVFFDYNKASLRGQSFIELNKFVEVLQKNPTLHIEIAGHTDSDGSNIYNLDLSQQRAESVVQYFVENGIKRNRMLAIGYGENFPVASNLTDQGKQLNRRTELIIHETLKEGEDWQERTGFYYQQKIK